MWWRAPAISASSASFRTSVGVGGDAASVERHGVQGVSEQGREGLVLVGYADPLRGDVLLELQGDALARAPGDDAPFGEVLPEEEVEHQSDDRREQEHDDPRQRLERIPVFGDDDQNDAENRDRVERDEEVCQHLLHGLVSLGLPPRARCIRPGFREGYCSGCAGVSAGNVTV